MPYIADDAERQRQPPLIHFLCAAGDRTMRLSAAMIENIRLRVTQEEKSALRAAAMTRGLTLSEYIREAASQGSQRAAA
ncbi:MAG: DUF1778 domain-containing protein [Mesorhizobium sp.]|nr:MAG: DUF1778 domain-containing protein [Mesorhizobium sp.]